MKNKTSLLLRLCLALCSVLFCYSQGHAQDDIALPGIEPAPTTNSQPLTILSWNLEHFTDPFDNPYVATSREDDGTNKSEEELERLALAIKTIDPDVISFQEVEDDRAVEYFLDEFLPGHQYRYFVSVPSMEWYQNGVVASRFPLGPVVSFREVPLYNEVLGEWRNRYNSRLLLVEVMVNEGYSFWLASLHLKSGREPEDFVWRREQIKVVKDFLARLGDARDLNVVVAGDMNFRPDFDEYAQMTGGGFSLIDPFADRGGALTHPSSAPSKQIDYIFFSEGMAHEYITDSASVATPLNIDKLSSISDHLPVVARFATMDQ